MNQFCPEFPMMVLNPGESLYHYSKDPSGLIARGFDPGYVLHYFDGSFHFADQQAAVSNCAVRVCSQIKLSNFRDAISGFPKVADPYWPDKNMALQLGIDGTYLDEVDACTELKDDGHALEIIIFPHSLRKLGRITLIEPILSR